MNKLPARTGWLWLTAGFALFRKQPGMLIMLLMANIGLSILISSVPGIGFMVAMMLVPSLSIALLQACRDIDEGRRVNLPVLATGFQAPAVGRLCKLGLVYVGVALVVLVLASTMLSDSFLVQLNKPGDRGTLPQLDAGDAMTFMGIFFLQSSALMLLCFATPLTYWQKMTAGKASFYSVFAVLGAWRPFLVMLLASFGIYLVTSMAVLSVLGNGRAGKVVLFWILLLLALVLQCAIFAAYRQIFGVPDDEPKDRHSRGGGNP